MNEIIAYCGLSCHNCPIYLATREINKEKKEKLIHKIIRICKEHYGVEYSFADITDCDGCFSESERLFQGCRNCKIRKCAMEKGFENCAHCEKYSCELLMEIFNADPEAKTRLDKIRNKL